VPLGAKDIMATIKITGVDEQIARFVSERSQSLHFKGQAEYLRNLIREDMARAISERRGRLEEILAPLHAHAEEKGYSDRELARVIEKARDEVVASKGKKVSKALPK
jgi:chorismate mutase